MAQTITTSGPGAAMARSHRRIAVSCVAVVLAMTGLAYAAVPLYRLYCQVTGYAGTTQRVNEASSRVIDHILTVHFDANVDKALPWKFEPLQHKVDVKVGENTLVFYKATNTSDRPVTGTAVFNVAPEAIGIHFNKIECFCFTEQRLEPGQSIDMPVSFYIDPAFVDDEDTKDLPELTLSYTFYPVEEKRGQTVAKSTGSGG
jgi:cytochrome c oxidase assembly protein subunit 11